MIHIKSIEMSKYTKVENVRILISLLKQHNIKHLVISPGGTNIPIVQGVQEDPFFNCYSVVDERSAMYFAIGLYLQLGEPIATTCTSAQATRNYVPGLTEAFYKHVPILAITCSKHPRYTYQECMQAPDQTSLPKDCVKKSYSLPYISNNGDRAICIRMINEAILELTHHNTGPVQLNFPIIDRERLSFVETELPNVRKIERFTMSDEWHVSFRDKKIMILVGEHRPFDSKERELIERFVKNHNAIVYTNHLSNLHSGCETQGNLLLSTMSQALYDEQYAPNILISIGGQTGDYAVYGKLAANKTLEHWRVSTDGDVVDTYDKLTKVFQCSINNFFSRVEAFDTTEDHSFQLLWSTTIDKLHVDNVELPLSNIFIAQQLHKSIPIGSSMTFAILNSLRSWSFFELDKSINCYSPVAAFGIDGGMSMAVGQSFTSKNLCFFVTGDLAFFYDMNSLGIRGLRNNIRIILVNNNKGVEFGIYGNPSGIDIDTYISARNHFGSAESWCTANGFSYLPVHSKEDMLRYCKEFVSISSQSMIMEVFTDAQAESTALSLLLSNNYRGTQMEEMKGKIKGLIGDWIVKCHEIFE